MAKKIIEKSVGGIIFYKASGQKPEARSNFKFLILHYPKGMRSGNKGHWDYVKGHIEEGENEIQTLLREVKEETGLEKERLEIMTGFRKKIDYFFKTEKGLHFKTVIFYLIESKTKNIKLSFEHDSYQWLAYERALDQLTFKNAREILEKANQYLNTDL